MGTIANLQYKFCAWEHNAEKLFLKVNYLISVLSSCFSHVVTCQFRRVCVEGFVSKHFNGLDKNIELVFNIRITTYNIVDYN